MSDAGHTSFDDYPMIEPSESQTEESSLHSTESELSRHDVLGSLSKKSGTQYLEDSVAKLHRSRHSSNDDKDQLNKTNRRWRKLFTRTRWKAMESSLFRRRRVVPQDGDIQHDTSAVVTIGDDATKTEKRSRRERSQSGAAAVGDGATKAEKRSGRERNRTGAATVETKGDGATKAVKRSGRERIRSGAAAFRSSTAAATTVLLSAFRRPAPEPAPMEHSPYLLVNLSARTLDATMRSPFGKQTLVDFVAMLLTQGMDWLAGGLVLLLCIPWVSAIREWWKRIRHSVPLPDAIWNRWLGWTHWIAKEQRSVLDGRGHRKYVYVAATAVAIHKATMRPKRRPKRHAYVEDSE